MTTAAAETRTSRRLLPDLPWLPSWIAAGVVTAVALVLRLVGLTSPPNRIFDEEYYAKDAYDLLRFGTERDGASSAPGFVAHPPLGKWCIALGEWAFGDTALGWRIMPALAGALSVLVLVRVGRRLFSSTLLGCAAGLLLALDGLALVLSRSALLDVFLALFVLVAFACLLLDRDARREGYADQRDPGPLSWWRAGAGVFVGLATGVKLNALYFLPVFLLLLVVWEIGARRTAGLPVRVPRLVPSLGIVVGAAFVSYLASWTGWFVTDGGWDRQWASQNGVSLPLLPDSLAGLWHYHQEVWRFHSTLAKPHDYQSTPWSWLTLGRPILFSFEDEPVGCGGPECRQAILALGTPLLWWSFLPALVVMAWQWLAARDWRAAAILLVTLSGWVPWMFFPHRTMYLFYTLPILPFLVLAVGYTLGLVLGPGSAPRDRRLVGAVIAASYLLVIAVTFAYFYPIYVGGSLTPDEWLDRMWFDSWI